MLIHSLRSDFRENKIAVCDQFNIKKEKKKLRCQILY